MDNTQAMETAAIERSRTLRGTFMIRYSISTAVLLTGDILNHKFELSNQAQQLSSVSPHASQPGVTGTQFASRAVTRRLRALEDGCQPRRPAKNLLRLRRKEDSADPNGFSGAAAHAVGVGRREALGVRRLAAA
ncbi:MAG TPA: hypothetical protein PLW35_00940, partial [Verrucomicrobiota bacterium]|nr:hypothetical protein [Verrucomicrobiota bacterium]